MLRKILLVPPQGLPRRLGVRVLRPQGLLLPLRRLEKQRQPLAPLAPQAAHHPQIPRRHQRVRVRAAEGSADGEKVLFVELLGGGEVSLALQRALGLPLLDAHLAVDHLQPYSRGRVRSLSCTGKNARKEGGQEADQEDQEGPQEKTVKEAKKDHEDKKEDPKSKTDKEEGQEEEQEVGQGHGRRDC